jgi:hypothetical protein
MKHEYLAHVDFEKAAQLLQIVDKCAGHSGKLSHLSNAAMTGLFQINERIEKDATEERKKESEAEAAKQHKLEAESEAETKPRAIPRRELAEKESADV